MAYKSPGAYSADWVDLYNRLYRERIIFVGQPIAEELAKTPEGRERLKAVADRRERHQTKDSKEPSVDRPGVRPASVSPSTPTAGRQQAEVTPEGRDPVEERFEDLMFDREEEKDEDSNGDVEEKDEDGNCDLKEVVVKDNDDVEEEDEDGNDEEEGMVTIIM